MSPRLSRKLSCMYLLIFLAINTTIVYAATLNANRSIPISLQSTGNEGLWLPLDTSDKNVAVVGEGTGRLGGYSFGGWYTVSAGYDFATNTIVIAWARLNIDEDGRDQIYIAFLKPVDADNDGKPEAVRKIVKWVWTGKLAEGDGYIGLDSLTVANGLALITWTTDEREEGDAFDVVAALYDVRTGRQLWMGTVRGTSAYEEFSRSCYVKHYEGSDRGAFLVIWYTSYDRSIDGKWLYHSSKGWKLSDRIDITRTGGVDYRKADQMMCIGGYSKALVVYRYKDREGDLGLYARLVEGPKVGNFIEIFDDNKVEELVGVHGAYAEIRSGHYFIVPFVSGDYVGYAIVDEDSGRVLRSSTYPGKGFHPYAIGLGDRFVLTWIDSSGEVVKVGNIDPDRWYIHNLSIDRGVKLYHPLIVAEVENSKPQRYILVYTAKRSDGIWVEVAFLQPNDPSEPPDLDGEPWRAAKGKAHGVAPLPPRGFVVAYTEEVEEYKDSDMLACISFPGYAEVYSLEVFFLPRDGGKFFDRLAKLFGGAGKSIHIAMAFWNGSEAGPAWSLARLVAERAREVDVFVVMDNSTSNRGIAKYLKENGVQVVDDSKASEEHHIMHDKIAVIDSRIVMVSTGSFLDESFEHNNNTAIVIDCPSIAYFYEEELRQLARGVFGNEKEDYSFVVNAVYNGNRMVLEGYFSPTSYGMRDKIPQAIYGYIKRSREVWFASYIFTTSGYVKPIYEALARLGEAAHGVFDEKMNVDSPGRRLYWFIDSGVDVYIAIHPYKMHAKLFVADMHSYEETAVILGSWNPTKSATVNHDENILVIREKGGGKVFDGFRQYVEELIKSSVRATERYRPTHPIIAKVMFYPDTSGKPDREWVEICNPTREEIPLDRYVIGDSDDLIHGDDEGMYRFPEKAILKPEACVFIAYRADEFYKVYGRLPDYEIVDTGPEVPDLVPYNEKMFTGKWNLDDSGDEVVLATDQGGFLQVVDAVWYGNSRYMESPEGVPKSGAPFDISGIEPGQGLVLKEEYLDAVRMSDKYRIVDLSNVPAYTEISLESGGILRVYAVDPDGREAKVYRLSVAGHTVDKDSINLTGLGLKEGVYSVSGRLWEDTPIGRVYRSFSYSNALGVVKAPSDEYIYCVASSGNIENVSYRVLEVDEHGVTVLLNSVSGTLNISLPSLWSSSSIKVYVDGSSYSKWRIVGSILSIDLAKSSRNVTVIAKTPPNRPVRLSIEPTKSGLWISIEDPDKMDLWVRIDIGSQHIERGGKGSIDISIELPNQNASYTLRISVIESTPSHVNTSYSYSYTASIYVRDSDRIEAITNASTSISMQYRALNRTHHVLIVLVSGSKGNLAVLKPSSWLRVEAVYLNGAPLPSSMWRVEGDTVWVDPPNSDDNVTLVGSVNQPTQYSSRRSGGGGSTMGGVAEALNGIPLAMLMLVIPIAILVVCIARKLSKAD